MEGEKIRAHWLGRTLYYFQGQGKTDGIFLEWALVDGGWRGRRMMGPKGRKKVWGRKGKGLS
jgi:hypothetical protein